MADNELIITDDLLDGVYLAKKRVDNRKKIFDTNHERYYRLEKNIILCTPLDVDNLSFRMFNMDYRILNSDVEPLLEIYVDPVSTNIEFVSTSQGKSKTRFMATFDHLEKNWDVRSYINGERKVSTLKNSLEELLTLPYYGQEEYEGFVKLLDIAQNMQKKESRKEEGRALGKRP